MNKTLGFTTLILMASLVLHAAPESRPDLSRILIHSTVRIEVKKASGLHTGTGFYYTIPCLSTSSSVPLIVTCAHLLDGGISGELFLSLSSSNSMDRIEKVRRVPFVGGNWFHHPDPKIDLTALPIASLIRNLEKAGKSIDMAPLGPDLLPTQEKLDALSLFQEVKIIGYPIGIWDSVNNLPIMRRGMIATDIGKDFNGNPQFLIDAAILPGSSGSPVLVADDGSFMGDGRLMVGRRVFFLGIVSATPMQPTPGKIEIMPVPTAFEAVSITPTPSSLGIVLKASLLREFSKALGIEDQHDANNPAHATGKPAPDR